MLRLISGLLCYLAGATIYLLWGSRQLLGHRVLGWLGLSDVIFVIRQSVFPHTPPEWVRFNLPDALWTFAYILVIDCFFRHDIPAANHHAHSLRIWTAAIPLIGILSELMQGLNLVPGTFDVLDLLSYSLPYIAYSIILYYI